MGLLWEFTHSLNIKWKQISCWISLRQKYQIQICCIKINSYSTVKVEYSISKVYLYWKWHFSFVLSFYYWKHNLACISLPYSMYLLNILIFHQNQAVIFTFNTLCTEKHQIFMHLQGFLRFWKNLTCGKVSCY